ncbi:MAG: AAA family ATPase [Bacteroidales bacterium]
MISPDILEEIISSQRKNFISKKFLLRRDLFNEIKDTDNKALIITGLRRCGKCTLMMQLQRSNGYENVVYLNFEDIRLSGFNKYDFDTLFKVIISKKAKVCMFDEIHIMSSWDEFVKRLLVNDIKVLITDSTPIKKNSDRNVYELFPFSYHEYLKYIKQETSHSSLTRYMKIGGMPEYVRKEGYPIINSILNDVILRDIHNQYNIRDINTLRQLAVYIITHSGEKISANMLTGMFNIKSCATIVDFIKYLNNSYLVQYVNLYDKSFSVRKRNPIKLFPTDVGILNSITNATPQQKLECIISNALRRLQKEYYYYDKKKVGQTNFIIFDKKKPDMLIKICWDLPDHLIWPEANMLAAIADKEGTKSAYILTENKEQVIQIGNRTINIHPAYKCSLL